MSTRLQTAAEIVDELFRLAHRQGAPLWRASGTPRTIGSAPSSAHQHEPLRRDTASARERAGRPAGSVREERAVLHILPHPGGGGETYVDALSGMEGYRFERAYLAPRADPHGALASILGAVRAIRRASREYDVVHVHGELASALTQCTSSCSLGS